MALLTKAQLIQQGVYYTPTVQQTVAAGATGTFTFQGYNAQIYGLNRILPRLGSGNPYDFLVTAKILYSQGPTTLFENVSMDAVQNLFAARSLRGALFIEEQTELEIDVQNTSAVDAVVNVELLGYAATQLEQVQQQYALQNKPFPRPLFISAPNTSIAAGATSSIVSVTLPKQRLRMYRMAMGSDSPASLSLKIRQNTVYIKPQVLVSQITDEFKYMDIILPIELDSRIPFRLYVDNLDSVNAHNLSFLAETYMV